MVKSGMVHARPSVAWAGFALLAALGHDSACADAPQPSASQAGPVLQLGFDGAAEDARARFEGRFPQPELVPGVSGKAWRSDGYSSDVSVPLSLAPDRGFTIMFDVALESYPSSLEQPADRIMPASFLNQAERHKGFDVHIDTFGRWGTRLSTRKGALEAQAPGVFPL